MITSMANDRQDLASFLEQLVHPTVAPDESWQPYVFTVRSGEMPALRAACLAHHLQLIDTFERQLADLAIIRFPGSGSLAQRQSFVAGVSAPRQPAEPLPGQWVYFPWLAQVVHTLDADDYFDLITDRNRDKITAEEQRSLRTRTVGVIGLSVGGEAAVTLAQEHLCGHLVIADFDRLDLSNLNRLNAGIDELGVLKTTIVARRIARIDPFLRVTVWPQGVADNTIETFLDGLDLLVEECDSLAVKFDLRQAARARRLNVVYAADERGFLSVEPYAHSPELAEFHGVVATRPLPKEHFPTPAAFMRALTEWVGGWDGISERSRRTLPRIGDTHSGYPQLAGEARFAAGQVAHVARRLLLGDQLPPFLGPVDLDAVLEGRVTR
ncbi:MAG: ThiF family adenylyltransferase [Gemmatimonadaceae bacterium]